VADSIFDQAEKHKAALLQRERAASVRLVKAYGHVWSRLSKQLKELTAQIEAARARGEIVNQSWLLRQERYQTLIAQITKEIGKFSEFAEGVITKEQSAAVKAALRDSGALLATAAQEQGIEGSFNRLNPAAVENQIGFLSDGSPLKTLLGQLPRQASAKVAQELIEAVAVGRNPKVTASRIRAAMGGNLNRALVICRTEVLRSYRHASLESYRQSSDLVSSWQWLSAKSKRSCLNCLARDGEIYELTQPMPAHPQCRCVTLPLLKDRQPPARELGRDWFARQSDDVKRSMMSEAAWEAFQRGEIGLDDFKGEKWNPYWGNSTYERSLKEMRARK
jgi:SPP1 gp7 family putative phage head morphogenesis protein